MVAVVGAGFMGQGFVHMAPLFGAGKVLALDFSDWRLEKARHFGATHTINPKAEDAVEALRAANNGRLADTVIVIAPFASAWEQALKLVEVGGTLHLGAPLPPGTDWVRDGNAAYFDEITVTSKYSSDHTDTYSYFRLLEAGRIDAASAVTHHYDIQDSAEAFAMLVGAEKSLKIVVYPHGKPEGL
jgi:L-iditol 2-dehydrogenase